MGPVIPALLVAIHLGGGTYAYVKKSSVQSFLGGLVAGGAVCGSRRGQQSSCVAPRSRRKSADPLSGLSQYIYSTFAFATSRVHSGAIVGFYNAVCMCDLTTAAFRPSKRVEGERDSISRFESAGAHSWAFVSTGRKS